MHSKENQTIILSDGRKLGFAEYGDTRGKAILICHGWPGSRLGMNKFNKIAHDLHLHLISIDRPGYGLSDFKKNRTLLDWVNDVEELVTKLQLNKFAILGISGGAPYAAVCAYKMPKQITKLGIVSGVGPTIDEVIKDNDRVWRFLIKQYAKKPYLATIGTEIHYIESKFFPKLFFKWYKRKFDKQILTKDILNQIAINKKEAFRNGIKGAKHDLILYSSDWGFNLKNIKTKTLLWYGEVDTLVPASVGKYYASKIKSSQLYIYPKEAHSTFIAHAEEIFKELAK